MHRKNIFNSLYRKNWILTVDWRKNPRYKCIWNFMTRIDRIWYYRTVLPKICLLPAPNAIYSLMESHWFVMKLISTHLPISACIVPSSIYFYLCDFNSIKSIRTYKDSSLHTRMILFFGLETIQLRIRGLNI